MPRHVDIEEEIQAEIAALEAKIFGLNAIIVGLESAFSHTDKLLDRVIEALSEAKEALAGIAADDNTWQGQEAKAALVLIAHMLGGK